MPRKYLTLAVATITGLASFTATAGVESNTMETAYQNGKQEIRVLLPDNYSTGRLYRPDLLIPKRKALFQDKTRLVLAGSTTWGSYTLETHQLLDKEGVKHVFDNSLSAPHTWNKQWMVPTLEALMRLARQPVDSNPKREPTGARDGVPAAPDP